MSAQILELLFFAGIAFFVINKLIATLGSTVDDDPAKGPSFFGGIAGLKDVTNSTTKSHNSDIKSIDLELKDLLIEENKENILNGIIQAQNKITNFSIKTFLNGARAAFSMIIEANANKNLDEIAELVDKRYMEQFSVIASSYGKIKDIKNLIAKVSEIYMFGNIIFIKVIFSGKTIISNMNNFNEEWTFNKSLISSNTDWSLSNVDRPQ